MRHYKENFNGEVIVVTGASRGIGREVAIAFAEDGAAVGCLATNKALIDEVAAEITSKGGKAIAVQCDVADNASVEHAFKQVADAFGGIDMAFINAGVNPKVQQRIGEDDMEDWVHIVDINLLGAYYTARAAIPYLKARGGGKLIATGSGRGIRAADKLSPYCVSKAGLHIMMKCLADELKGFNIACNIVNPGPTLTPMAKKALEAGEDIFTSGAEWVKEPKDFVPLVQFIASMPNNGPSAQYFSLNRRNV